MEKEAVHRNRTQYTTTLLKVAYALIRNTRKLYCPAVIQIRCVKVFVDYCVDVKKCATVNSLTMAKRGILKQLEAKLSNQESESLRTMTRFYVNRFSRKNPFSNN